MLNSAWLRRGARLMVFGGTASAHAIAGGHRATLHDTSFLRANPHSLEEAIVIDSGDENTTLAEARRAALALSPRGGARLPMGVVVESWSGFAAALQLDAELGERGVRIRPLCSGARLARQTLLDHPWPRLDYGKAATALIFGTGTLAEHLVIALFRSMHLSHQAPRVTVVAPDAAAWVAALKTRLPQLDEIGTLTGARGAAADAVCAAYVVDGGCFSPLPAMVPVYWFAGAAPDGAIAIAPFDWADHSLFDDPMDVRARAVHSFYYEQALRDGMAPGSRPSMFLWEELPERFRQASRYQADHVPIKLAMIGCREVAGSDNAPFRFAGEEVEALARVEHQRWSAVQLLDGWRYGAVRDDAARLTPFLKPYDELTQEIQDRDRMPVRQIPAQLARIGHGVARDVVITISADAGAEPGWRFPYAFSSLLADIAAQYPGRQPVLASTLATDLERRAVARALDSKRALLCLLLTPKPVPEARDFMARAARLLVLEAPGTIPANLHIHLGTDAPPGIKRLVVMEPDGRVRTAPWL